MTAGEEAEHRASAKVRMDRSLGWQEWADAVNEVLRVVDNEAKDPKAAARSSSRPCSTSCSAPVVATLLVSEALLGLLSRYAPQMNAFSVSLTVKSLVALAVLMVYFGVHLPDEILRMAPASPMLERHLTVDAEAGNVVQRFED